MRTVSLWTEALGVPSFQTEQGQAIQRDLQASGCPGDAFYQVCDVQKESDIKRLIQVTVQRYGCLDCLVNNAGIAYAEQIDGVSAQDFLNLMEINTVSCLLASKYALPYLRETKGNIINMASTDGVFGDMYSVSYASSKGAVIAMTKALAIDESKYGVRVNRLCLQNRASDPSGGGGGADLLTLRSQPAIKGENIIQFMGRLGNPKEVALGVLFLAADGTFCTGLDLVLSGGAEPGFGRKNQVDAEPEPSTVLSPDEGETKAGLLIRVVVVEEIFSS
ncbi:UNVERIFIED_CONTAM: hypothetical protein K2H54_038812 [Gekko kuhli]